LKSKKVGDRNGLWRTKRTRGEKKKKPEKSIKNKFGRGKRLVPGSRRGETTKTFHGKTNGGKRNALKGS